MLVYIKATISTYISIYFKPASFWIERSVPSLSMMKAVKACFLFESSTQSLRGNIRLI